ncbi:tetratricopeptide repeat protein [Solimicrobium silvestre]|uniref:tetratricopeptide repeat protein n=1 Tax=Solimicrobium silvestre TaxID=2099400 RepID=UPI0010575256|nr:tetratricopeptide repeat protein [Solimicrobium silvestre]
MTRSVLANDLDDAERYYADKDYTKAAQLYKESALSGNVKAQVILGMLYQYGRGLDMDYSKAISWYQKAANQGEVSAQDKLGSMYENGQGVAQDYKQAAFLYRKAADLGFADAQFHLGILYAIGGGVEQSYQQALAWYTKAAGVVIPLPPGAYNHKISLTPEAAAYNIGVLYEYGLGVKKDLGKAGDWYARAAWRNLPSAQFKLGFLQEFGGDSIGQSYRNAEHWYQKATEQGYALAQSQLTMMRFGVQTPCEQNDTDYSVARASAELPLKPGLWKIQSYIVDKHITESSIVNKSCYAEKTVCVTRPSSLPQGKFWPQLIDGKVGLQPGSVSETDTELASTLNVQSSVPIYSLRVSRTRSRSSDDQYDYKSYANFGAPWLLVTPITAVGESKIDRIATFVGACPKPEQDILK